jgi:hypothetical protein
MENFESGLFEFPFCIILWHFTSPSTALSEKRIGLVLLMPGLDTVSVDKGMGHLLMRPLLGKLLLFAAGTVHCLQKAQSAHKILSSIIVLSFAC